MKGDRVSKVIPILPAKNMNEQCAFYESIGFAVAKKYKAPPYAVVEFDDIAIHFWSSKTVTSNWTTGQGKNKFGKTVSNPGAVLWQGEIAGMWKARKKGK